MRDVGYFARRSVFLPILAAFPLITLPLVWVTLGPRTAASSWIILAYTCGLSVSHFLITFSVYLSSRNLAYFSGTVANRLVYFAVPGLIFLYFGAVWLVDARAHPVAAGMVRAVDIITPLATYTHLGRQSFGILQILKRESGLAYSRTMRRLEQTFFLTVPLLQAETTFIGGGQYQPRSSLVLATTLVVVLLFISILVYGARARLPAAGKLRARAVPLSYFLIQTASMCLSVFSMRLYLAADAVHYTEYHTIMYPRVTRGSGEGDAPLDRWMAGLRRRPILFYGILLGASAIAVTFLRDPFGLRAAVDAGPVPFGVLFHMLNGIFLFHFFVEAFIWKFSNPFFKASLSELYFSPSRQAGVSAVHAVAQVGLTSATPSA